MLINKQTLDHPGFNLYIYYFWPDAVRAPQQAICGSVLIYNTLNELTQIIPALTDHQYYIKIRLNVVGLPFRHSRRHNAVIDATETKQGNEVVVIDGPDL